jgi:hypothetical protein
MAEPKKISRRKKRDKDLARLFVLSDLDLTRMLQPNFKCSRVQKSYRLSVRYIHSSEYDETPQKFLVMKIEDYLRKTTYEYLHRHDPYDLHSTNWFKMDYLPTYVCRYVCMLVEATSY